MKRMIAIMLAVVMMMGAALAEVVSPTMPVMKPTEIRNEQGEILDTKLVVEVVQQQETKKETTSVIETVAKKATEITQIFAAILPNIPALPTVAAPMAPEVIETVEAPVAAPATVAEVKQQVEEAYVQVFGEKAVEALKEVIALKEEMAVVTEAEVSVGDMTIDEIAPLYIEGYEENMGNVHIVVESVTQYKDTDVLVAMIGIVMTEEEIAEAIANGELTEEEVAAQEQMMKWLPLDAVVEEGKVVVAFTEDAMKQADGKENVIVLMRANELEENI